MHFKSLPVHISKKTKQNSFAYVTILALFSPVHTNEFSFKNEFCFCEFSPIVCTKVSENTDVGNSI